MPYPLVRRIIPAALLIAGMSAYAAPPSGEGWTKIESLSDEFDGAELDQLKWQNFNPYYSGPPPGMYSPGNVVLSEGRLQMRARQEPGVTLTWYSTSLLQSNETIKYGYFEARLKTLPSRINSAFWLYQYTPSGTYEIDIVESGGTAPGMNGPTTPMPMSIMATPAAKAQRIAYQTRTAGRLIPP